MTEVNPERTPEIETTEINSIQIERQEKSESQAKAKGFDGTSSLPTSCSSSRGYFRRFIFQNSCFMKSYIDVIRFNRNYRLYLLSHLCQHTGDWFVRVAALLTVQRLAPGSSTALATLIMTKMLPEVILTPIGGALADTYDRRWLMIIYDALAAVAVLGYIVAAHSGSLGMLYVVSAFRASVCSFYEPVTRSIVPMMVIDAQDLKRATTINGIAWSGMLVLGGFVAGYASATFGVEACFAIDSATYFLSCLIMCRVHGNFSVATSSDKTDKGNETDKDSKNTSKLCSKLKFLFQPLRAFVHMTCNVLRYLRTCGFGPLVLLKASGSATWGSADVLNVSFAHVEGDEEATSRRIGTLYSFVGLGCLFGPVVINYFIDVHRPATLQLACISALALMMVGWIGISNAPSFWLICVFTSVRTFGSAIIWVDSTLLLQQLSAFDMLGRVLGLEYASALGTEATVAFITGRLEDGGHSKHDIAMMSSMIGGTLCVLWSIYHVLGCGAANGRFNRPSSVGTVDESQSEFMTGLEGPSLHGSNVHGALV